MTYADELAALEAVVTTTATSYSEGRAIYKQYIANGTWDTLTETQQNAGLALLTKRQMKAEIAEEARDAYIAQYESKVKSESTDWLKTRDAERSATRIVDNATAADKVSFLEYFGAGIDMSTYVSDWAAYVEANPDETDMSNYTADWNA